MSANHKVTIILLGESGVGKSSLFLRYCKNKFREHHIKTSIDKFDKQIVLRDTTIHLELWDTAGHERFKAIYKGYFKKADGVILVYDLTQPNTFNMLSSWLSELRELNDTAVAIIVGNKTDLQKVTAVSDVPAMTYAQDYDLECFKASAKNNENIEKIFEHLTEKVLEKRKIAPFFVEVEKEKEQEVQKVDPDKILPPVVSVPNDVIKLEIEKQKPKQKESSCC
ncbi:ras-related protein Rab-21 [Trichonephila inaurata madagascariensis]|uniref:Ras-related protein Rab-21 n=1 Tax=Trichonephila inaurata madagascariensis TaxID=2747483 RepID=A0A8X6YU91_9ARAC|nr:ras-related protein Rab-21 [Trichonephila inaurata madagascariensis]